MFYLFYRTIHSVNMNISIRVLCTPVVILCFLSCKIRKLNWLTIFKLLWKRCAQPTKMNGRQSVVRSYVHSQYCTQIKPPFIVYISHYNTQTIASSKIGFCVFFFVLYCCCSFLAAIVDYLLLVLLFKAPTINGCEWNKRATNERKVAEKKITNSCGEIVYAHTNLRLINTTFR